MRVVRLWGRVPPTPPTGAVAVGEVVLLLGILVLGSAAFLPLFDVAAGALAAAGAGALGLVLGVVCARTRLTALTTLALAAVVHMAVAPWVLPDVGSGWQAVLTVWSSLVTVWRDALTLPLPLSAFRAMTVLPWVTGLAVGTLSTRLVLAGRERLGGLAALLVPVVAITWGGRTVVAPTVLGPGLVALVLVLWAVASLRGRQDRVAAAMGEEDSGLRRASWRSGTQAVALVAAGVALAVVVAPTPPGARVVLRDHLEPPLDLTQYATPLSLVRTLETDLSHESLLTASGLPAEARIRLATLDSYDGVRASIGERTTGEARFQHVGTTTRLSPAEADGAGPVTLTVTGYSYPWVPMVADTVTMQMRGDRATALGENLYNDPASATAVVTAGLEEGDVLDQQAAVVSVPSDTTLRSLSVAQVALGPVSGVPASVAARAAQIVGSQSAPLDQVRALQQALRASYYSDGTRTPSEPGHGAARLASMVRAQTMVGDDEQYSVLMMLMCRSLGIPARVALGFRSETDGNTGVVTGEDVAAWVEIPFEGRGWVPFDVTPDRDQIPQQQSAQKVSNPEPQVLQPPLPRQDPAELPPAYQDDPHQDDQAPPRSLPVALLVAGGALGAVVLVLVLIALLKSRRRLRRRRSPGLDAVTGAWDEILDRARDLAVAVVPGATRRETAARLSGRFPSADLSRLARAVDAQVFAGGEPSAKVRAALWDSADAMIAAMGAGYSRGRRLLARFSVRSLLRPASRPHRPRRPH